MLNARQRICYQDTCDVWQVSRASNTDGVGTPGNETYTKLFSGVRYRHLATPNFPQITPAGRVVEANIMTTDKGYFDCAQLVPDAGLVKNTTPGSVLAGRWFAILSTDSSHPAAGRRQANYAVYPLRAIEHPPAGVS